ncbi:MAG: ribulose 1,5-bisphosphate carboxylase, partial [Mesorhizobium sp.]
AYSPLSERVKAIMPLVLDHEQKTGKKVMYAFGISHADPDEMMRNHDLVAKAGGNCAVVNINSVGFGGMAYLRKRSSLVLHAHRNGWDILTRHPGLGMDFKVWQQFWRLLGVDQFQINGIASKYWEPDWSFISSFEAVTTPIFSPEDCALPVAGSGQWGGQAPET